jgi:PAS domain S-box-containing protein
MNSQTILGIMQNDIMESLLTAQQQRLLDTLLDNLDGMIYRCLYDDSWTMIYVSKGCETLTGYSPVALLLNKETSYENIMHVEDREKSRAIIAEAVAKGQRFQLEYRIVRANGEVIWVS